MRTNKVWDGFPEDSQKSGWHWLEDGDGLRPILWRGSDWPEASDRHEWKDGFALLSPGDLRRARYHGPVTMPRNVAEHFEVGLLFGVA